MNEGLEHELGQLFEDTRVEGGDLQLVRMTARASDVVAEGVDEIPGRWVSWIGALALCGVSLVWSLPGGQQVSPPGNERSRSDYEQALETYLDVTWNEGSLWAGPLEGAADGLSEEALHEVYADLLDDMQL